MESDKDVIIEEEKQDDKQPSLLKNLGVEELKEIEKIATADQIKIQKAKEKIVEKIQQMQNKVDEYFGRIDLDKLRDEPDVSLEQIDKSERLMHRIANYIFKEMVEIDENEDSMATYVEKIEQAQSILQTAIDEGIFINKLELKNVISLKIITIKCWNLIKPLYYKWCFYQYAVIFHSDCVLTFYICCWICY